MSLRYGHCQVQIEQKHRPATSLYCRNGISRRSSRILERKSTESHARDHVRAQTKPFVPVRFILVYLFGSRNNERSRNAYYVEKCYC